MTAVVVNVSGCYSNCDHCGDVAVVSVVSHCHVISVKIIVVVVIVVGATAVKSVVTFGGVVVVMFIVVVVTVVVGILPIVAVMDALVIVGPAVDTSVVVILNLFNDQHLRLSQQGSQH